MDADLLLVVSRLIATLGRIVVLARARRQEVMLAVVCSLLALVCHALKAVEKSLERYLRSFTSKNARMHHNEHSPINRIKLRSQRKGKRHSGKSRG